VTGDFDDPARYPLLQVLTVVSVFCAAAHVYFLVRYGRRISKTFEQHLAPPTRNDHVPASSVAG
jgi:hypothetical protein